MVKLRTIHKRTLLLIYDTEDAIFEDLLERDKSRTIHEDNIHALLVEIYKSMHYRKPSNNVDFFRLREICATFLVTIC